MRHPTTPLPTKQSIDIDDTLLNDLKRLGIVQTQYDLSRLCGKNHSYFSCMRAKGYGLKVGSLTFMSIRLRKRINEISDARVSAVLTHADRLVQRAIEEKCRLRELELSQCG
jgi:hypothetical protein